jgi:predicted ester cyclase
MSSSEENATTMRRAMEAINARDLESLAELVTPSFVRHDYEGISVDLRGPEGLAEGIRLLLGALPDLRLQVREVIATDDRAVVYASTTGTHEGAFFGAYASGQRMCFDSVDLYRLEGGKIAESWPWPDLAGIRRRMAEPEG